MPEESKEQGRTIGPLALRPIAQERVWGTAELPARYATPGGGKRIGELWLTAKECVCESAAAHGETLAELVAREPEMFGAGAGEFPLLIKLLFPREKLSVQVHPNDAQASALGQRCGKTECWYVISAEPGAQVAVGFCEELSKEQVREATAAQTLESKLRFLDVKAGDMVYVDAGTVHAIGPGAVILETQQYSDVTYRMYDYGRERELHVDAGLNVTRNSTEAGLVAPVEMHGFTRLVASPYFVVDRFVAGSEAATLGKRGEMQILVALDEGCFLESSTGTATPLLPGRAVVLPAESVEYSLRSAFGASVIRIAEK
jgi:mannose-6-phosphate isomerase